MWRLRLGHDRFLPHFRNLLFSDILSFNAIRDVPGGKVNILGDHSISHSKKKVDMSMCPIPNGFRDRAI
jgi:hypothetical protein